MNLKKFETKGKKNLIKKIKILLITLLIIFLFTNIDYLSESKDIAFKAASLRQSYWGAEYFFEFGWFFSKRNENQYLKLDLNSEKFEKYLQSQYTMFRLKKSCIFSEISEICFNILNYQLKEEKVFLRKLADYAAMAVIKTLNNNIVGINQIDAKSALSEYTETYGSTVIIPMNIFKALIDNEIINLNQGFYSYKNPGTYYYYSFFSKDLMPMIVKKPNYYECRIDNSVMNKILDDFVNKKNTAQFPRFKEKQEYKIFETLIYDWNDPEQYYEFKDSELQKKYLEILINKIKLNDKLFNSLLINSMGLGLYYYNPEYKLRNHLYDLVDIKLNDDKK